jgi:AraC-like DNA-binding protein
VDARGPSARIEIEAPADDALAALDTSSSPAATWTGPRQEWPHAALISLVNIVLNIDPTTPLIDPSRLAVALRACLDTFVAHSDAPAVIVTPSKVRSLVDRAREAMERRAPDPDFTVEKLASELGVTREYLWRVFTAELSISPRDALRAHRRQAAVDFLEDTRESGDRVDMNALARRTGFGSHHALRRALKASDLKLPR